MEKGPLSEQQKSILRTTWADLYAKENRMKLGVDIFVRLFTAYPDYRLLFRAFRDIEDIQELAKTPKLKAHAFRVVAAINNLIENLDTPDIFVEMLKNIARSHHNNNIPTKNFENLGGVLLETFASHLGGDKFTPKAKDAWLVAYTFIVTTIIKEYGEASDESGGSSPEK